MAKVYYHKNCVDGFGAAFAFWLINPNWNYQPIQYGEDHLIEELNSEDFINGNDTVYFLDFCPKYEVIKGLFDESYSVFIFDHHKTQQETFERCLKAGIIHCESKFSLEKSGAMLAYEYASSILPKEPIKRQWIDITMFEMIQDRDLWLFKNPSSKALHAWLICNMDFEYFLYAYTNLDEVLATGFSLLKQTKSIVDECCKSVYFQHTLAELKDLVCPIVNSPIHQSEICDKLLNEFPNAKYVACEYRDGNKLVVSLRSRKDFDCSVIAKHYGGGGHAQASGFTLSVVRT